MEEKHSVNIDSDVETRKGVHSNLIMAETVGGVTRLDFLLTDIPRGDGSTRAVLSSRVFMNNEDVISLRDMLNSHTAQWKVTPNGEDC